jgi:drug/metabolite transporter (DMT)-like permease
MTVSILLLPLLAAVLHAGWNALVKLSIDRLTVIASISLVTSLTGMAVIPFVDAPASPSWLFLGLSTFLHYAYYTIVYLAYRAGDLSFVYPIARGSAPVLVALGAWAFGGEVLSLGALFGLLVVCAGIALLSARRLRSLRTDPLLPGLAFAIGLFIAAYSVCDGLGVRRSQSPFGYIAWLYALEFPVVLVAAFVRRGRLIEAALAEWRYGAIAGVSAVAAYGLVIYASALVPIALVSALRETSVIIAALIGTLILGEPHRLERVAASVLVAIGVVLMMLFQ